MDGRSPIRGIGPTLPSPVNTVVTRIRSAAWLGRSLGNADESGLRILFYHRVADVSDELAVPKRRFREQMDFLVSAGYRVVDVVDAADLLIQGYVPEKTIGLSFDDGYLDVAENALPLLSELGFQATVFVTTGVTDGRASFPCCRERQQPALLTWEDVVQLDGGTLRFEAHSATHPNLLAVDDRRAAAEIAGSKRELEARLGRSVTAFSYPAGLFGARERRLVIEAGYRVAVSCEPGVNLSSTDRFALRRRRIDSRDSLLDFRAKVGGGHDSSLPMRGVYRRLRYGEGGGGRPRLASSRR